MQKDYKLVAYIHLTPSSQFDLFICYLNSLDTLVSWVMHVYFRDVMNEASHAVTRLQSRIDAHIRYIQTTLYIYAY